MDDPNTSASILDELRRENERLRASVQQSSSETERLRASLHQSNTRLAEVSSQVESLQNAAEQRSSRITLLETLHNELLEEDEKPCPCCGKFRHIIGKETHEQLDFIPAKVKVIEHVRLKYGCPQCEADASPDGPQIVTADKASDQRLYERLAAARSRLRRELAVSRLAQFRAWLESQQAERGGPVLPKSPMGQAIQYTLNQWDALCVYTTDGRLAIDNNASENGLRRVAIGRKNWLFAGSDNGGRTAATLFSLIATCQRHKVEPMTYLRDVLTRIAATPISQLNQLLPDRWRPAPTD